MPSVRVTLVLNAQQSNRTVVLLQTAAPAQPDLRAEVLKLAAKKLRAKRPSRLFLRGGRELRESADVAAALEDGVGVYVSRGEGYVGKQERDDGAGEENDVVGGPDGPAKTTLTTAAAAERDAAERTRVLSVHSLVEPDAVQQLRVAASLPGIVSAVGLPDLHPGNKFPIGCAFVSHRHLHPPLIGGDVGCGMAVYRTRLRERDVSVERDERTGEVLGGNARKMAERLRGLEGAWLSKEARAAWLAFDDAAAGDEWDVQLGSIGRGNHFLEVQVVDDVGEVTASGDDDEDRPTPFAVGDVILLVHSGSRSFGQHILASQGDAVTLSWDEDRQKCEDYLALHDRGCRWAAANRDAIAARFLAQLEGGEWCLDEDAAADSEAIASELRRVREGLQRRKILDIWHNNVTRIAWPPDEPAEEPPAGSSIPSVPPSGGGPYFVHRKGAAPTLDAVTSAPLALLPLPGSRGTKTIFLAPIHTAATSWGRANAWSLAHGAGRSLTRAQARTKGERKEASSGRSNMSKKGGSLDSEDGTRSHRQGKATSRTGGDTSGGLGGYLVCEQKELVWEEAPEAYKDVQLVARDLVEEGVARIVASAVPRVTYKCRKE